MTDGKVTVPPDSSGKNIDTSELTRADGTVVERQRVVIGDPTDPTKFVDLSGAGLAVAVNFDEVVGQLKRIALLLEIMTGQSISVDDAA